MSESWIDRFPKGAKIEFVSGPGWVSGDDGRGEDREEAPKSPEKLLRGLSPEARQKHAADYQQVLRQSGIVTRDGSDRK